MAPSRARVIAAVGVLLTVALGLFVLLFERDVPTPSEPTSLSHPELVERMICLPDGCRRLRGWPVAYQTTTLSDVIEPPGRVNTVALAVDLLIPTAALVMTIGVHRRARARAAGPRSS